MEYIIRNRGTILSLLLLCSAPVALNISFESEKKRKELRAWLNWMEGTFLCVCVFLFNWNLVALQCCISLCCTSEWISYYTYVSSLSCQNAELSFLCYTVRFSLVIYFIRSPFQSPQVSHPPFPPWCPCVCSLLLCLYVWFANWSICTIYCDIFRVNSVSCVRKEKRGNEFGWSISRKW